MSTPTSEWPYSFASGLVGFSFVNKEMHTGHTGFVAKLFTSLSFQQDLGVLEISLHLSKPRVSSRQAYALVSPSSKDF